MKIKLVIGSLLALSILIIVPSIPAIEYNIAVETNTAQILKEMKNEKTFMVNTIEKLIQKLNVYGSQQHVRDQPFVALFWHMVQFINKIITVCVVQPIQALLLIIRVVLYFILEGLGLIPHYKI